MKNYLIRTIAVFCCVTIQLCLTQDQGSQRRLPLNNIALYKAVSGTATEMTCGEPQPTTYCAAVESELGLRDGACDQQICNQRCPHRDRNSPKPTYIDMLDADMGTCVELDYSDVRKRGSQSYRFYNRPRCGMNPANVPKLGPRGQFTLSVWLKQYPGNSGVILEKIVQVGFGVRVILTVLVNSRGVVLQYFGMDYRPHFKFISTPIPSNIWCHLAIQVYNRDVTVFVNEVEKSDDKTKIDAVVSDQLDVALLDGNEKVYIVMGHRARGTSQFVGRIQEFRWYDVALTNREIEEIATGNFEEVYLESNCLCPGSHPKINPEKKRFCVKNGVDYTNSTLWALRLNKDAHPLAYMIDGDPLTTWVSRSDMYMPGGLTLIIDLINGEYEVFYVTIKFYNSLPKTITISRNSTLLAQEGRKPLLWGYYADNCYVRFNLPNNGTIDNPDDASCISFPEEVPYSNSNITLSLVSSQPPRPGHDDFYGTPRLMEFVKATQIHIRFTNQYYTVGEDVHGKHTYYGIREVEVIGRCNCHGHAVQCDTGSNPYQCKCLESSNTEGNMCERCKPLFNDKEYRIGNDDFPYNCRKCQCNNHADRCHYDRDIDSHPDDFLQGGGGVCDDCKHNTMGRYCELCKPKFYRKPNVTIDSIDSCSPCRCRKAGVINETKECDQDSGQCLCKAKVTSRRCNTCMDGYYNLDLNNEEGCEDCQCFLGGAINRNSTCDKTSGQCKCKKNVRGRTCTVCNYEFKNLTDVNPDGCEPCNCSVVGAVGQHCNPVTGQCNCRPNVEGLICDQCEDGYWNLSTSGCRICDCDSAGTEPGTICDKVTGQCICKAYTQGRACNECRDQFYNLDPTNPQGCQSCSCDPRGSVNGSLVCDKASGECSCKENVEGRVCNLCRGNTFGLRDELNSGCEPCDCDPMGTALGLELEPNELVCDSNSGQCACLSSREGRRCDECSPGFYLPPSGETGCLLCDCHPVGSTSQICNNVTGMCPCKPLKTGAGLTGRRCDECARNFWSFNNLFGTCQPCGCNEAGSESDDCNVITGQCTCKGNVIGQRCDTCRPGSSQLSASNPMGCYSHPEQQASPVESNVQSRRLTLSWNPPDYPNGDFLSYELYRNEELIYNTTDTSPFSHQQFNDSELLPYTNYDYYLETTNIGGSVLSPTVRVQTLAGIPTGIPPLEVSNIRAHQASFSWGKPEVAHGPIETYVLQSLTTENSNSVEVHYRGLETQTIIHSLTAFSNYTFTLRACTSGGCGDSLPVVVLTHEAKPATQRPPRVVALSNTSFHVSWDPPDQPNGVIIEYELMMRGSSGSDGIHRPLQRRIFRSSGAYDPRSGSNNPLNPPMNNYTITGLKPFKEYQFLVSSSNKLGSTESPWISARTLEGTPLFMYPPRLDPISSSSINITWKTPDLVTEVRGEVTMYQVILIRNNTSGYPYTPPTEEVVIFSGGPNIKFFIARGFDPYSSHNISINLCNSISCIKSATSHVRTLPAAPQDQSPPVAQRGSSFINISWEDPAYVNGPRPTFALMRSKVAFSEPPVEMSQGVRFPGLSFVRFPSSILPRDASYTGIELKFRTFQPDGLLFFAAAPLSSDGVREEYIVVQLREGRPWFLFDAQNNPTSVTTTNDALRRYDDGEWHTLEARRYNKDGFIEVDEVYTGSNTSTGTTTVVGHSDDVYLGGLPLNYELGRPDDENEHVVVRSALIGCLKDIRVQRQTALGDWSNVTWEQADQWHRAYPSWQGCPINLNRESAHFLGRGFIEINPEIGTFYLESWSLKLSFRTTLTSGILFCVGGKENNVMIGTIIDGVFRLVLSEGQESPVVVVARPQNSTSTIILCDGNWHDVTIKKISSRVIVEVDENFSGSVDYIFSQTIPKFSLEGPIFLGGVPSEISTRLVSLFSEEVPSFGGCMREIEFDRQTVNMLYDVIEAVNVNLDGCPLDYSNPLSSDSSSTDWSGDVEDELLLSSPAFNHSYPTCQNNSVDEIYSGFQHYHIDNNQPTSFTLLLYKVVSSNSGGETASEWMVTRSGESPPQMVTAVFNEQSLSGEKVSLDWKRPLKSLGVITNYTISATKLYFGEIKDANSTAIGLINAPVVNYSYSGDIYTGVISGLSPYTTYSFVLTACNLAGCTQSAGESVVTTLQEIPSDVRAPTANVNATSMTIQWVKPEYPNGLIISYRLYHNSSVVYEGLKTDYIILNLPIFTKQHFQLEACTVAGCNISKKVTLFSGQIPPSYVDQPMVTVMGPHKAEMRWLEPAIMNGIFHRYVLYIRRGLQASPGEPVYNSTDNILEHTLFNLTAGARYYAIIAACTGGGCKLSSPTPFQTQESAPGDVPTPEVMPLTPYSFNISWKKPGLPNGVVTLYKLYQNQALIYNSTAPSSVQVDGLKPWSRHEFRLQACTNTGCSFSPAVTHRTNQSAPEGSISLSVTVLSPRSLQALWDGPRRKNGRIIYYVICSGDFYENPSNGNYQIRKYSKVMLNSSREGEWTTVDGLIPYTEYIVKVNGSNLAGYVISNMRTVAMPPGSPNGVEKPLVSSQSPYSILVSWKDPARNNARGNSLFQLQYRAVFPPENEQEAFNSATRQMSYNLTGLSPFKEYEFQLVASNEYGATYSGWTSAYTMQAKPSFLDPPIIYEIDAWSLYIEWDTPSSPNGIILNYNLFQNDDPPILLPGNVTNYKAGDLVPFTTYTYKVEACTVVGCTISEASRRTRTSASAPEGLESPTVRSDSPESVFVTWRPPRLSNGILDRYTLERRRNLSDKDLARSTLLGVFVPSQSLRYLDEGDTLTPFTTYQYRVNCSTLGGGSISSDWASVTTKPGRPAGVLAPVVVVTGSESVHVKWRPPIYPNGPLISYEVVFPIPRVFISNVTLLSKNISGLIPYTDYQISLITCTQGGCTESPSVHALTFPDVPQKLPPPLATPISERTINVQWAPPEFPNGPDLRYELSRKILSQPLASPPSLSLNITQTIYSGTDLFFRDRSLEKFTECEYKVSVFNSEGSLTSNGTIVTSLAGYPKKIEELNVAVHNHTAVLLWWGIPSIQDLQGEVREFIVRYNSTLHDGGEGRFTSNTTKWKLNNLYPGTNYQFQLSIDNGAHIVSSQPIFATTDDGAPHGLHPPVVYPLSPSQLRVSWLPPEQPNGRITEYNVIVDDVAIQTNQGEASARVIENLKPYTIYNIQLEVCTVYACTVSNVTQATTKEAVPSGVKPPNLKLEHGNQVAIQWDEPARLNGLLKNYYLHRRKVIPCSNLRNITKTDDFIRNSNDEDKVCSYVKCPVGRKVCGGTCYHPTQQVCCDGALHQVAATKECCGANYVALRQRPSDICCDGRFVTYEENHQCCYGKYVKVGAGEVCCRDPVEDRVIVGVGDSCCQGIPYFSNAYQLCCGGRLHDGYNKICCGNSEEGAVYDVNDWKTCCGSKYLLRNSTLCCTGNNKIMAHHYGNDSLSEWKCCMHNAIATELECCNGVGYDPSTEVCADVATASLADSSLPQSCGSGTVCPLERFMYASCDRCDVDREEYDCFRSLTLPQTSPKDDDVCTTPFTIIYSGPINIKSFVDTELDYYTTYQYKLLAENKVGAGESEIVNITTAQAPPDDVLPPDWSSEDRETISLRWKPPGEANGIITNYALMRDGLEIWSGLALRHTDRYEVLPYREYEYVLKVCTNAGCSSSEPVLATSVQGIPEFVSPPRLTVTSPTSILIKWFPPRRSNGVIERYLINETDAGTIHTLSSQSMSLNTLRFEQTNLKPYSLHSYSVTACTKTGCTSSDEKSIRTSESLPTGVWHRSALLPLNSTAVDLIWMKPEHPNGEIEEYRIVRRVIDDIRRENPNLIETLPWTLVYDGTDEVFNFVDVMDEPGSTVEYKLIAINGVGSGVSPIKRARLPRYSPNETPKVRTLILSPTSIQVNWTFEENGNSSNADNYSFTVVLQEISNEPQSTSASTRGRSKRSLDDDDVSLVKLIYAGSNQSLVIDDLTPFTRYSVRIRSCFSNLTESDSCNIGSIDNAQTTSAPPSGLANPIIKPVSPTSVTITWKPPNEPNGVITSYRVYRRVLPSEERPEPFEDLVYLSSDHSILSYSDVGGSLRPFTVYEYRIQVANNEGVTSSDWIRVTTQQGIPSGLQLPTLEALSAFAIKATWSSPMFPNGILSNYRLEYQVVHVDPTIVTRTITAITTPSTITEAIFSGLRPYTRYRVRVVAVNQAMKEGTSLYGEVTTLPAPPSELSKLEAVPISGGTSLLVTWSEPALPNGNIEFYRLYEVGYEGPPLYVGRSLEYQVRRLKPYTEYTFLLEACTGSELCTKSPPSRFRTAETIPEAQKSPQVTFRNATAIMITWIGPLRPNGRVISFEVLRKVVSHLSPPWGRPRTLGRSHAGSMHESARKRRQIIDDDVDDVEVLFAIMNPENRTYNYTDVDLKPFTNYAYAVRTSTRAGSVESSWVQTETPQGPPTGMNSPTVTQSADKNPTSLIVTWQLPDEINGQLQSFRLYRNDTPMFSFPPDQFSFVDDQLQPFTIYSYQISACTGGGCVISGVTNARTLEEAPSYVAPPRVDTTNASSIQVSWLAPTTSNGVIVSYRLYVDDVIRFEGTNTDALVDDLDPYTEYRVSVEACTSSGCQRSENIEVSTDEAPPTDIQPPEVHATGSRSVEVDWRSPDHPNGKIIRYELHRNGELVFSNDGDLTRFHDFGLNAGTTYSYVVTASNKMGSVQSTPPAVVTTTSSAPSGMTPPTLTAKSSSSILAEWETPAKPNGEIQNYTLFVRHNGNSNDEMDYNFARTVFSFVVRGLHFYKDYSFWVRVCTNRGCIISEIATQRTMEAIPSNQMPPRVNPGFRNEMLVTWNPPLNQNGAIRSYLLRRRRIIFTSSESAEVVDVSNQTRTTYTDTDISPFTQYQYQVIAENKAGKAPSQWSLPVRSNEAPPDSVPTPELSDIRSRSVRVDCGAPEAANGVIRFYHVHIKEVNASQLLEKVYTSKIQEQTVSDLLPSTSYTVISEMCTQPNLCTKSRPTSFLTLSAPPRGQGPIAVRSFGRNNASLVWNAPEQPNGKILRYEVFMRRACPPPEQPFLQECTVGPTLQVYSGTLQKCLVADLDPYARYAFSVTSYNNHGKSESEWESIVTSKSEPVYVRAPSVNRNISMIMLSWEGGFVMNSRLEEYELTDRDLVIYSGTRTRKFIRRLSAQVHEFKILVRTDTGKAQSPVFIYDTTSSGENILQIKEKGESVSPSQVPFYQSVWFILIIVFAFMIIMVIIVAVIIQKISRNKSLESDNGSLRRHKPSQMLSEHDNQLMRLSTIDSFPRDESVYDYAANIFSVDKDLEEYEDHVGRILSKSYPTESFNRSTNQLVREESYFNQPMERKIDPSVCDVIMSPDDFETNFMDQDKLDNVNAHKGAPFSLSSINLVDTHI